MDLILVTGLAVLGVFGTACSRIVADEFKAWAPWIVERTIRYAVSKLPEDCRERYEEEWRSHVNDVPGDVAKLIVAVDVLSAARKMAWDLAGTSFAEVATDAVKLIIDISWAAMTLVVASPAIIVTAVLLRLERRGPILKTETRMGLNGRQFALIKFNTAGPETLISRIAITTRIDEIPQLVNVLRGEMSLVGPRPLKPSVAAKLSAIIPGFSERHSVRPGLTGWAQINYPYGASLNEELRKFEYDLYYTKHRGLLLDCLGSVPIAALNSMRRCDSP